MGGQVDMHDAYAYACACVCVVQLADSDRDGTIRCRCMYEVAGWSLLMTAEIFFFVWYSGPGRRAAAIGEVEEVRRSGTRCRYCR